MMVVAGALGLSFATDKARQHLKDAEALRYNLKDGQSLSTLTKGQLHAFMMGVEAQQSYKGQLTACFKWDAIRHGHAYYAGMGCKKNANDALIDDIRRRHQNILKKA